ncbi:hypothetical protein ACFQ1E_09830 [Sphingomonas canadensis]|uniref:Major facilitator superfamily (MFS) profile domain-containing protein n=1 Tax=Sphingomonas canadensis TaxID=1219257 RepID=A0ABW3H765_9SPHN|nr:hypothetical protein [Sphingomonas canadensis]MCW3836582.1 hypothetical protein [Sphingomonas canadensis]
MAASHEYETTLDRAGLAMAAGSLLGGGVVTALLAMGGTSGVMELVWGTLIGAVFVSIGIAAVVGPLWLVMHVAGLRRARHAAMVGALVAMVVVIGARTWGFGMGDMPPIDGRTLAMAWLSALATSLLWALAAALIGLAMWRIAYRRVR